MPPVLKNCFWALLPALLMTSMPVSALQVSSNVGIDLRYTDNATLVSSNEIDDIITTGNISASVSENQGPVTGRASGSLNYVDYLDNTFGQRTYLRLDTAIRWTQVQNVLSWDFNDFYSQTKIDSLAADTPTNTEDINVANLAAHLTFRPADRHRLTITPSISDYYYETTGTDNQQAGITAGWSYLLNPALTMSLTGSYRKVVYENDLLSPDTTNSNVRVGVALKRVRSSYSASVGVSRASQDSGADTEGLAANLAASYQLSSRSTVNANVSTNITDTSNIYLTSALDPNTGNFSNVQTSNDVVRNSVARIAYNRSGATANLSAWVELRELDYKAATTTDRKIGDYGASIGYSLSPKLSASVRGSYVETEEQNPVLTDKYYQADAQLGYTLSRKLTTRAGVRFQKRDSDNSLTEYDEYSIFAGLAYRLTQ